MGNHAKDELILKVDDAIFVIFAYHKLVIPHFVQFAVVHIWYNDFVVFVNYTIFAIQFYAIKTIFYRY